jgi:hypothetical protein
MAPSTHHLTRHSERSMKHSGESLSTNCSRCGGFLVSTFCISPDQGTSEFQIPVWKCLQCGDVFDDTILKNRLLSQCPHANN